MLHYTHTHLTKVRPTSTTVWFVSLEQVVSPSTLRYDCSIAFILSPTFVPYSATPLWSYIRKYALRMMSGACSVA